MRQRWVGALLFLVAAAAGIGALWTYLSDQSGEMSLVLEQIDGEVVLRGSDGIEKTPEVGAALSDADHLETGDEARAVLGLGQQTRIRLGPESSLRVTSVGPDGAKLELEDGALEATVRPGAPVRVASAGREVVATNAEFAVGVGDGVLQVEARAGEVGLSGTDQTRLEAGSVATIIDRKAVIAPIPEEILLSVRFPGPQVTQATTETVVGQTVAGAKVRIIRGDEQLGEGLADADGNFAIDVKLAEGSNEVTVVVTDPLGKQTRTVGQLRKRDTLGPRGNKSKVMYGN